MIDKSTVSLYLQNDMNLTLVKKGGNAPILKNWQNQTLKKKKLFNHIERGGNLGFSIGEKHLVVDVDPENGGMKSYKKLEKIIGKYKPNTISPSGGFHIYFKLPKDVHGQSFKGKLGERKEFEGVDILGRGKQVVIPQSERPKRGTGVYEWGAGKPKLIVHKIPKKLLLMVLKGGSKASAKKPEYDNELVATVMGRSGTNSDKTPEEVWKILSAIPNDKHTEYDTWVEIGMSIHDWDAEDGLALWRRWSKLNKKKHNEREMKKKWNSFSHGGGKTFATLVYHAKNFLHDDRQDEIIELKSEIQKASLKTLELNLFSKIRKMALTKVEMSTISKLVSKRLIKLQDGAPPMSEVRKLLTPNQVTEQLPIPDWAKDWLYVTSHSVFLNTDERQMVKREGFDLINGWNIPRGQGGDGGKISAFKHCADEGFLQTVSRLAYVPFRKDTFFTMEGTTYGNLFNPKSVPKAARKYSKEGKAAIQLVKDHFMLITNDKRNADILIDWCAHNVQEMGIKILWSPLIQSIEGTGKTFIGQLLTSCIGHQNVGIVSPSIICSDFNDYAVGSAVGVFQELRIVGQNRYEVVNAVKPLITDNYIAYHPKGVKGYTVMNTTNYIATTNFKDAIPLEKDDRRWFVIFMAIGSLSEIRQLTGKGHVEYFSDLFSALQTHSGEIKKWLMGRDLTEFKKIKTAPMTKHKLSMIATENTGNKGVKAVEKMIATGGNLFNTKVVNLQALYDTMLMENVEVELSAREKISVIKRLGFTLHPKKVKFKGVPREFWTSIPMSDKEIVKSLKARKPKRIEG